MTDVHHDDHTAQRAPLIEILLHDLAPVRAKPGRYLGVAVAGQVGDPALIIDVKDNNLLRTAGCFTRARQRFLVSQCIDCA